MNNKIGNILLTLILVMMGLFVISGCNAYGNAVARNLAMVGAQQAVVSGVRNEIEGPRGTTVNVNSGVNNVAQQQQSTSRLNKTITLFSPLLLKDAPQGQLVNFFTYRKWKDLNGNGTTDLNEFFGVGECFNKGDSVYFAYTPYCKLSPNGKPYGYYLYPEDISNPKYAVKYRLRVFDYNANLVYKNDGVVNLYGTLTESIVPPPENFSDYRGRSFKAIIEIETQSEDIGNKTESIDFKFCEF